MERLWFDYFMEIKYTQAVKKCCYTFKCMPKDSDRQRVEEVEISIKPEADINMGEDSFGNRTIYGSTDNQHTTFTFKAKGIVETGLADSESVDKPDSLGMYKYSHGLNKSGEVLRRYYESLDINHEDNEYNRAVFIMKSVYKDFLYVKDITDTTTTAEEAWKLGKGVCQDYAHIMIALCQMDGIPARYAAGMMIGEGYSHAWVEVLCADKWYGMDPTNDVIVDSTYIKLGVGRDASDCLINRGLFYGRAEQSLDIRVEVGRC